MYTYFRTGHPNHQRWVNDKKFDGGQLSEDEKTLRNFYSRLLNFRINSDALMGDYQDIHYYNREHTESYSHRVLSFVRWSQNEKLVIVSNFGANENYAFELKIPKGIIQKWNLGDGAYETKDVLYGDITTLDVKNGIGKMKIVLEPLESFIFKIQ